MSVSRQPQQRNETDDRKIEDLRREIQVGVEQADRGELSRMDAMGTLGAIRARRGYTQ